MQRCQLFTNVKFTSKKRENFMKFTIKLYFRVLTTSLNAKTHFAFFRRQVPVSQLFNDLDFKHWCS